MEIWGKSLTEMRAMLEAGEVSSVELTDACLACIAERKDVNVFISIFADHGREAAQGAKTWGRDNPQQVNEILCRRLGG